MRIFCFAGIVAVAMQIAACASPAQVQNMQVTDAPALAANSSLRNSLVVNLVGGGQETNPLWTSEVSGADFREALTQSLQAQGILAGDGARYRLDATLISVEQPLPGFDMTVTSTVRYVVTEVASGSTAFDTTVQTPFTAEVSDAFVGVQRLRLANEGSIRSNIAEFISRLTDALGTATPVSALGLGHIS